MIAPGAIHDDFAGDNAGQGAVRGFGSALVAIGLTTYYNRSIADTANGKNIAKAMLAYHVFAFLLNLTNKMHKTNATRAFTVSTHFLLMIAFYNHVYKRDKKDSQ